MPGECVTVARSRAFCCAAAILIGYYAKYMCAVCSGKLVRRSKVAEQQTTEPEVFFVAITDAHLGANHFVAMSNQSFRDSVLLPISLLLSPPRS